MFPWALSRTQFNTRPIRCEWSSFAGLWLDTVYDWSWYLRILVSRCLPNNSTGCVCFSRFQAESPLLMYIDEVPCLLHASYLEVIGIFRALSSKFSAGLTCSLIHCDRYAQRIEVHSTGYDPVGRQTMSRPRLGDSSFTSAWLDFSCSLHRHVIYKVWYFKCETYRVRCTSCDLSLTGCL